MEGDIYLTLKTLNDKNNLIFIVFTLQVSSATNTAAWTTSKGKRLLDFK